VFCSLNHVSAPEFCYHHRVTYAECTLGNHVYYANYLNMLEVARGAFFRQLGEPLLRLQDQGLMFPVIECSLRFLAPARYDDRLSIHVWLRELRGVRLTFAYGVENEARRVLLEGRIRHVCASLNEKPRRLPGNLIALLSPYLPPAESPASGIEPAPSRRFP
jgi:acyl-CoA thioester hydrolase